MSALQSADDGLRTRMKDESNVRLSDRINRS